MVDQTGTVVPSQAVALSPIETAMQQDASSGRATATHSLRFAATVPAVGYTTMFVLPGAAHAPVRAAAAAPGPVDRAADADADVVLENAWLSVVFSGKTHRLINITNKQDKATTGAMDQGWFYYQGNAGDGLSNQNSGAYIFRPVPGGPISVNDRPDWVVTRGAVFDEVRQTFADWCVQTVRLYHAATDPVLDVQFAIGAIPVVDFWGKEIVTRWTTSIASAGVVYTDANGRSMRRRGRNQRPYPLKVTEPESQNYYPVNAAVALSDPASRLTLLTDRSQGAASLADGQVEVMVHRRLVHDDGRGVGEALNEPGIDGNGLQVVGVHRVLVAAPGAATARPHRRQALQLAHPLAVALAPLAAGPQSVSQWVAAHVASQTFALKELPPAVHLQSLEVFGPRQLLLRLTHQDEVGDGGSGAIEVDVSTLFPPHVTVTQFREVSLTANQDLADVRRLQWQTSPTVAADGHAGTEAAARLQDRSLPAVTLRPQEIRTWIVTYQ